MKASTPLSTIAIALLETRGWTFDLYSRRWTHEKHGWLEQEQVEQAYNRRLTEGLNRLLDHAMEEVRNG